MKTKSVKTRKNNELKAIKDAINDALNDGSYTNERKSYDEFGKWNWNIPSDGGSYTPRIEEFTYSISDFVDNSSFNDSYFSLEII